MSRKKTKIRGTSERPRLSVFRSNKKIYAQIINDKEGKTLVAASEKDFEKKLRAEKGEGLKIKKAQKVGEILAKKALKKKIKKIVFDRRSYPYHGRIKALAEGARKGGLEF